MSDLWWLTALEASDGLRRRQFSCAELVRAHLDRIATVDQTIEAYVTVVGDDARRRAAEVDTAIASGRPLGVLAGVPFSAKDVFATRAIRTTAGSPMLGHWVPAEDATAVRRLLEAGAILLGKVNTHEFAYGVTTRNAYRRTTNPWDRTRIAGGSSGGSAAALAAGLCPVALGTDTAGSIRLPAALTGVAGLKPTYGRVSCAGVVAQSFSADHAGPMARSVADLALVLAVIAGADPSDPLTSNEPVPDYPGALAEGARGLRLGVPRELLELGMEPGVASAFAEARRAFEALGCRVRDVSVPLLGEAVELNRTVIMAETTARHDEWAEQWFAGREPAYGADVRQLLDAGREITAPAFVRANRRRTVLREAIAGVLASEVDLLLTPAVPFAAPRAGVSAVDLGGRSVDMLTAAIHFLCPFSLTGFPALALPAGFDGHGLPVSIQLVGRSFDEVTVLRAGHAFEQATRWHRHHPAR